MSSRALLSPGSPSARALASPGAQLLPEKTPVDEWMELLTPEQLKLLYMLQKYAKCAAEKGDEESWMREIHLSVLIYEGTVDEVFDYDYAPQSVLVGNRRVWMNVSQEGRDDIDDLREHHEPEEGKRAFAQPPLINGLKLSTEDLASTTAFQVSADGMKVVREMDQALRDAVDIFLTPPKPYPKGDKLVRWEGDHGRFAVYTMKGRNEVYKHYSTVTAVEEVSYVASPFVLDCVKQDRDAEWTDNSTRAHEVARADHTLRDEVTEHVIMENVKLLISEWVPFGANQIVALNETLGSADRCKGGMFTDEPDNDPTHSEFRCEPGLTTVKIHDFDHTAFINLEADIHYTEDGDGKQVTQVENFGIHFSKVGTVVYGLTVQCIGASVTEDGLSADLLCRVLADVHEDSSKLVDSLLSSYQRKLLNMVYLGDHLARDKFNVILCDRARPATGQHLRAEQYRDGEDVECETCQMIGDIEDARDIGPFDVLVLGRRGVLLAGPNVIRHDRVMNALLMLLSLDMFIQTFFQRSFTLGNTLNSLREAINTHQKDPASVPRIRRELSQTSADIIMLGETLGYLEEAVLDMPNPPFPKDVPGIELYSILEIEERLANLKERVRDLGKNVQGCRHEQEHLQGMTEVINTTKLEEVFGHVEVNTKDLVSKAHAHETASNTLRVIQYLLAATVAFDLVDRFTALDLSVYVDMSVENMAQTPEWQRGIVRQLIWQPGVWFLVNVAVAALLIKSVHWWMARMEAKSTGLVVCSIVVNQAIHVPTLWDYVKRKPIDATEAIDEGERTLKKLGWLEEDAAEWDGAAPRIEIVFQVRRNRPAIVSSMPLTLRLFAVMPTLGVYRRQSSLS